MKQEEFNNDDFWSVVIITLLLLATAFAYIWGYYILKGGTL